MLKTGLHLDNHVLPTGRDLELATWLGPAGLKVMDNLGPRQIADLVARFGGEVQYAYRPYFAPPRHLEGDAFAEDGSAPPAVEQYHAEWRQSVRQKLRDLFAELDRRGLRLERPLLVQVYCEPNLPRGTGSWEGFGQTIGDLRAYDRLQMLAADEIERDLGDRVIVGWGPLTIGNRDVRCPGDPDDGVYYVEVCRASLARCRALFTNQYPTIDAPRDEHGDDGIASRYHGRRHRLLVERHPDPRVPVYVMEMSVQDFARSGAFADGEQRAEATVRWFRAIEDDPNVRVVYQWIAGDLNEPRRDAAFDFGRFYRGDRWRPVATALRAYVAGLADRTVPTHEEAIVATGEIESKVSTLETQVGLLVAGLAEAIRARPEPTEADRKLWSFLEAISPGLAEEGFPTFHRQPAGPPTGRRFAVWNGVRIGARYRSLEDVAGAIAALAPEGDWEREWLVKAGEGGSWQAVWDPHPLAVGGAEELAQLVQDGQALGLRVTPYVVIRGRPAWNEAEWEQVASCAEVAGRVVLNLEEGTSYWNGATTPEGVQEYLDQLRARLEAHGAGRASVELCAIPRQWVVDRLGGDATMRVWLGAVSSACWECYDASAPDLSVPIALARVEAWAPPGPEYRVPVVQRSRVGAWAGSRYAEAGLHVWHLDGD